MADAKTTKAEPAAAAVPADFPLSLEEFCSRLSASDRRVELITAFARSEKALGFVKDTESAYSARFAAFIKTPA